MADDGREAAPGEDPAVAEIVKQVQDEFPWVSDSVVESHMTLLRANAVYSETLTEVLAELGLSTARFNLLWLLYRTVEKRLPLGAVAAHMGVTIPSTMKMVQALESEGWLRSVKGVADKRVTFAELTASGQARLVQVLPEAFKMWEGMWSGLTGTEKRSLVSLLSKLRASLMSRYIGTDGLAAFRAEHRQAQPEE